MDLLSGQPYWRVKNGLVHAYPRLSAPLACDALVVGGGITGALIADHLSQAGLSVCVIDRGEVAWGSTSASTALLQYEIDTELQALARRYGLADALLAYRACEQAVGRLQALARSLRGVSFQPMQSLYYASRWHHEQQLLREGALRQTNGFDLKILDRAALVRQFGIDAPVGLLTRIAAEIDPYQLTHRLLKRLARRGGKVHARTSLAHYRTIRGGVQAHTDDGIPIRCQHLILAAGYENQRWLDDRVARNRSSYAFVSEPLPGLLGPLKRTVVWESARPYLYLRRTADQRLLAGGEDDAIDIPLKRDARVPAKAETLAGKVSDLFPQLPVKIAFAWAGTFAETADGLPYFGPHEAHGPGVQFAMAYGGNGITYSLIGAELLRDSLTGKRHPCAALFSFERRRRPSSR